MSTAKKIYHTTTRGVEPFDKNFGIGAEKRSEYGGFTPYENECRMSHEYRNFL
jgi:hypothetical protein